MYSYDTINRIENSSQQKNIFIKENNNIFNKKITEDTKKKIMENNITLEKQMIKEKNKEDEKVKKRLGEKEKVQKPKKKKVFKNYLPNQKQILKVTGDEGFMKPTERGKRASMARFVKDSENTGGFDYDDYSKCREIIFKIKLNPDEFKLLQKEKKNKGKVSPYLFK